MSQQTVQQAQGGPMLHWAGKRPLERIEYYPAQEKEVYGDKGAADFNKIFWGDNLQVLAHLLKEYRGKIDLIYIDPPFGTGVDYFKTILLRGEAVKGHYSLFEEKQYANIFEADYFLQFMYERLLIMKELLSDGGFIFVRFDYHFGHYIKIVLDEVFGIQAFKSDIIVNRIKKNVTQQGKQSLPTATDSVYLYSKREGAELETIFEPMESERAGYWRRTDDSSGERRPRERDLFNRVFLPPAGKHFKFSQETMNRMVEQEKLRLNEKLDRLEYFVEPNSNKVLDTNWADIPGYTFTTGYPTENSEALLERVIAIASKPGDLVADFFAGSGTTAAVAQKMGRKWLTCDINLGSVQTTAKRLSKIVEGQLKQPNQGFIGNPAFKVCNVNDYEVFRSEVEAKEVVMNIYGVDPIKRSYFDGVLGSSFVKVMPMNRVLNKLDVKNVLKSIEEQAGSFTVKSVTKNAESIFEEGVTILCSGTELDVWDFLKRENTTGVSVEIRDLLTEKQSLIFKKRPEAKVTYNITGRTLTVGVEQFYSPILMRKLEAENSKVVREEYKARVEDFRQVLDSISLDVDYDGELFNAAIMDVATKQEVVKANYSWVYDKPGRYRVAVKLVDVLGEEYFETYELETA